MTTGSTAVLVRFSCAAREAGADFYQDWYRRRFYLHPREQKERGRGQATSVIDVARARDSTLRRLASIFPALTVGYLHYHDWPLL